MNKKEILGKLQEIFRDVFEDESLEIQDSTSSADIDEWDSLNHINLIMVIENEFKIKYSFEELATLKNVGSIIDIIDKKKE